MRVLWLLGLLLLSGCGDTPPPPVPNQVSVNQAMGADDSAGFSKAVEPRAFRFPQDHGPHEGFKNEWWYLTGNLGTTEGRRFGYQVTFFRIALAPDKPAAGSHWRSRHVWMAHAAVTDAAVERHHAVERFSREALDLAAARANPLSIHVGNWRLLQTDADGPWQLNIDTEPFQLTLDLTALRPPVLQGDKGLSRKSAEPGNASYYYSIPRLKTVGGIRVGGEYHDVSGLSWLDREWSTSALGADQAGWDWFSMQLNDGSDIMYYQLRRKDGSADPLSAGSIVFADGRHIALTSADLALEPIDWWQSNAGVRYPIGWSLRIPEQNLDLRVNALIPGQLMDLTVEYWEGAIELKNAAGERVGRGYLELAGYR